MSMRSAALALCVALGSVSRAGAQAAHSPPMSASNQVPVPGAELTVTLVTFGLGEEVFERFGHNAIWFHDANTGTDTAYHWGLFNFNEPGFLVRFLTGDTKYSMGPSNAVALIEDNRTVGRPITLQRLNLTPPQAVALRDFVRWNAREENKFYRYDYFRDNCSTRLRDAIDHAVDGAIRRATDTVHTTLTYRRESVRLTSGMALVQIGIDIALGRPADEPLTQWDSFFIPMRLRDALRRVSVTGTDGVAVPLVQREEIVQLLPDAKPLAEALVAPSLTARTALFGLLLAGLIVWLRTQMSRRRAAAWAFALIGGVWSLLCGVLGVILVLAWLATRHVFWADNQNVLLLTSISLALVVLIPLVALTGRAEVAARAVAALVMTLGLLALAFVFIPGSQEARAIVALVLPVHVAFAWALSLPREDLRPQ